MTKAVVRRLQDLTVAPGMCLQGGDATRLRPLPLPPGMEEDEALNQPIVCCVLVTCAVG